MIEQFRRWLGHGVIAGRQLVYEKTLLEKDGIATALFREQHALLEAFKIYDKVTFRRRRTPQRLPDELADLANVAAQFSVVGPTLTEEIANHHRNSLLGPGFKGTLLEWKTATALARINQANFAWLPPNTSGPEFIARVGDLEFEVECKHVSHMIGELFGDQEAAALADVIVKAIRKQRLCGEVRLDVSFEFVEFLASERVALAEEIAAGVHVGRFSVEVGGLRMEANLSQIDERKVRASDWYKEMMRRKGPLMRAYAFAGAQSSYAVNPIALFMAGPQREAEDLRDHIWKRKFEKAANQCSQQRGAVLSFEWEGVTKASVFAESEGMQHLMERTFAEHPHVAAIIMRCDNTPSKMGGMIDYATQAYLGKSEVTRFPDIANLLDLDPLPTAFERHFAWHR